ncbi:MAG: DHH family phosphoesterase [Candidatus Micrarchaeia archaeon]
MEVAGAYKFRIYPDAKRQKEIDERLGLAQQLVSTHVLIVSHSTDLDGIASAALLLRAYSDAGTVFTDYTLQSIRHALARISSFRGIVFIADLNVNIAHRRLWQEAISKAKSNGSKIIWLDHHPWAKECVGIAEMCDFAIFGENRQYCASEIVARLLGFNSTRDKMLLKLVHADDFAIKNDGMRILRKYQLAITYANTLSMASRQKLLRRFADSISKGVLVSKEITKLAKSFEERSKKEISKALSNIYYSGDIAVAFASNKLVFDDLLDALFKKSGKEIVIAVNTVERKASIRSKEKDISRLAQAFGGGGHPHAAGFNLSKGTRLNTEHDRKKFVEKIANVYARVA